MLSFFCCLQNERYERPARFTVPTHPLTNLPDGVRGRGEDETAKRLMRLAGGRMRLSSSMAARTSMAARCLGLSSFRAVMAALSG